MHKSENVIMPFMIFRVKDGNSILFTILFMIFSILFSNLEAQGQLFQLFMDEILSITLSGDLKTVFKGCSIDSQYHPVELSYVIDQKEVKIPIKIKNKR
tara:strand:+ start:572 stop:868 length:297 start_codon:yes stop_codon:yes gene_type:complete